MNFYFIKNACETKIAIFSFGPSKTGSEKL